MRRRAAADRGVALHACWRSVRPRFLLLAPLCAGLAIAAARHDGHAVTLLQGGAVLLAALLAHAAVNLFNEHHDFASGLDALTEPTPFSGGSGALVAKPAAAGAVRAAGWLCLVGAAAIGAGFVWRVGPALLLPGGVGVALVLAYTGWLTRRPWLCLLAPGAGFGLLMVVGAYQALTGGVSVTALAAALPPTLLASALLLANQLPDIDADRRVGRYHLAIAWGERRAARLVAGLVLAAFVGVALAVALDALPRASLLMGLALPAALWLAGRLWWLSSGAPRARLLPLLALNVAVLLASLALLNLGLWLAGQATTP